MTLSNARTRARRAGSGTDVPRIGMAIPEKISVGLKEWASVCSALEAGEQMLILRKGGIHESAGEFELEHPQFLLFPTYLHQKPEMLKPEARKWCKVALVEPEQVRLSCAAEVSDIMQIQSRSQIDAIEDQHIWTPPLIDMRFNYRPQNPLYLLLVRIYRLAKPVTIANTPAYAGCKSWVPLEMEIEAADACAVLDAREYERRRAEIRAKL